MTDDDKEWLTYWIIFGLSSLLDDFFGFILSYIPYFYWIKLIFFAYLLAPQTRGASTIYNKFVKDFLEKNKDKFSSLIKDVKGASSEIASEAKKTALDKLNDPSNLVKAAQVVSEAQESLKKTE